MYTLELLHFSDQEASGGDLNDIPRLSAVLNALRAEDLGGDGVADNTITLSSGDAFLPGLFFDAAADVFGSEGIADILVQNELDIEAVALGNHEFDAGTAVLAGLIDGSAEGTVFGDDFGGTEFPYLSANLDFSTEPNLAGLVTEGGQAPQGNVVSSSTVIEEGGELIGVVGATTPILDAISSPDGITILPEDFGGVPTAEELDALAAEIQAEVDALLADNPTMNKVILLAHMQDLDIELALAERLENVDIIAAGGSHRVLTDETDRVRAGDQSTGDYPQVVTNAGGTDTLVVNTGANYTYVGRLAITFDDQGNILADSYDPQVSGAYATDAQGVSDLGAEGLADPELTDVVETVQAEIVEGESNVFGIATEFLNANRRGNEGPSDPDGVRTQETNLGNLTADANLAAARQVDPDVVVSLKNGGGIRASIGEALVVSGGEETRLPNSPVLDAEGNVVKPEGGISQNDIAGTLAFNNGLSLLTLTREELVDVLEHAVGDIGGGRFPQVSGLRFSFDASRPEGDRIETASIVDEAGTVIARLVEDGALVGDPAESFRIVTLGFLADGGDGYPFPTGPGAERVDITQEGVQTGAASFADDFSEQDALAEYLAANFATEASAFDQPDLGRGLDARIQNLEQRSDTVDAPTARDELTATLVTSFQGESDPEDDDSPEGASEVVAHEDGRLYVTNGNLDRVDIFDIAAGAQAGTIDLSGLDNFDGVQSLAVSDGLLAVAVENEAVDGVTQDGQVAFFDAASGTLIESVAVGNLPDQVVFSPDGTTLAVMNEGEFNNEIAAEDGITNDAPGSVSLIAIDRSGDTPSFAETRISIADFADELAAGGVRVDPNLDQANQFEPEYASFTADGSTLFVALQENNAAVAIDVAAGEILAGVDFGTVDHSQPGNELDFNDNDVIEIANAPVRGLRMPDAHTTFEIGGETYLATANEGDGRGDATEIDGGDEVRVGDIVDGDVPGVSFDPDAFPTTSQATALPMEESQEVADVPDTAATGAFEATLDETAETITVSGTFENLSAPLFDVGGEDQFGNAESAVHVHLGAAGENGPIFGNTTVTDNGDGSGSFTGTFPVTEDQAETFRNDGYYVNLHTDAFNGGELRGQIDLPETPTLGDIDRDLGRLTVSTIDGDTDGDGDIDELHSFGGRGFTIFDTETFQPVFDSGAEFEEIVANLAPERFLDDDGELGQDRADNKGVEPEAIDIGRIGQQSFAFIGLERDSGVMVYNVSQPEDSRFVTYIDGFETGNLSPEIIEFIPEDESTTGSPQIAVSYEISGTTAVYDLGRLESDVTTESYFQVALGRDVKLPGYDFWSDILELGNVERIVAEAFDTSPEFQGLIDGLTDEEAIDLVFNNARDRDATDAEQAEYAPEIAEQGFDGLFFDLVNSDDAFLA